MNAQPEFEANVEHAWSTPGNPLDRRFTVTFFRNYAATDKREEQHSVRSLAGCVQSVTAPRKDQLPWLKLAIFGDIRSDRNSLRHDANVQAISGIEADYDGGEMPFEAAVEIATKADLLCLIYTSPSYAPGNSRWRVLCPTSRELPPAQRDHLLGRLNGAFGGIFSVESWTLSQAYYFGSVERNPEHRVELVDGTPINQLDELDETWRGKPNTTSARAADGAPRQGPLNEAALLEEIRSGKGYHAASVRLLGRWARDSVPYMDARQRLMDVMQEVDPAARDTRWEMCFADIDRCLHDIYGKEAAAKDRGERAAGSPPRSGGPAPTGPDADGLVTEDSVAAAFAREHGETLRFCHHAGQWHRWGGAIWRPEETRLAFDWARGMARELAASFGEDKVIVTAGKAGFASGVERFAQADRAFARTSDTWNRDPWLLGTPGGTVDLRTGELRPARQDDHISRSAAVAPSLTAECPLWDAFLLQAAGGDKDLIGFLQRWFGYCLTGITREHALLFVYGPGGNGKGVLLVTVASILSSYATTAAMDTFTVSKADKHPTDLAMLHGARLVMTTETEEGHAWAEARIKALTGGDPITARFMRRDFFTFTPAFKLTVSGNHKPALRNVDDAARRRFNIVPFLHKPAAPDRDLQDKLRAEWPGILRWLIDGCLAWQREGLKQPKAVLDATAEYFAEQDLLAQWIEECCERGKGLGETSSVLFASWCTFAQGRGEGGGTAKWFGTTLGRQGFRRDKDCTLFRGRGFLGLRVIPEEVTRHWQEKDE
ncbi:phage/plasmid primase, P4 family [Muricoccus aerilatus]|uniref:phage/plasmid primase, P4 family n=1 Tax=Muricoccus aerilatus TaxID=452982 RepID=UPI000694F199|nr:phage/plasmid primase, P4 family [Roseomonas aerilata]